MRSGGIRLPRIAAGLVSLLALTTGIPLLAGQGGASLSSLRFASTVELATRHPRLYYTNLERPLLNARRNAAPGALIWKNLLESADWCLSQQPHTEWIAPATDDPYYENLYDRFYAMMRDMAVVEHLAFAGGLGGGEQYGEAARTWALSCCRVWRNDALAVPDGGKAYAVSRLLKGLAVAYDLVHDRFSAGEAAEIRDMLATTAGNYYEHYFTSAAIAGPGFHTHHATVEIASFGVVALALLGEVPEATQWLEYSIGKFRDHLLPNGLAPDGAQVEGATFWASTLQYRFFFMDALRRVTGIDLFREHPSSMNADLALASIAARKRPGWNQANETVVLEPSYGQLDYYAPVLLAMAREYRRPVFQHLALWDESLGHLQQTRYITPHRREQLLFELGGYALVWYDPTVEPGTDEARLSFAFPSVDEVYARSSWEPGGLLVALKKDGQAVVHAGGEPVLIAAPIAITQATQPNCRIESDDGTTVLLSCRQSDSASPTLTAELERPHHLRLTWTGMKEPWSFSCHRPPEQHGAILEWERRVEVQAIAGTIRSVSPEALVPVHAVGNGRLALIDPMPMKYPIIEVAPNSEGEIRLEVRVKGHPREQE